MGFLLELLGEFFLALWNSDERPEARTFIVIGVGVLLFVAGVVGLVWYLW